MCSNTESQKNNAKEAAKSDKQINQSEVEPVFNTQMFIVDNSRTVTEEELIDLLGQPDSIDNWNWKKLIKDDFYNPEYESYPIVEYQYGDWYYEFNNGNLHRIAYEDNHLSEGDNLRYNSKDDFLAMFGCKERSDTVIEDNNVVYIAKNCGVKSLKFQYENGEIIWIQIDYSDLFLYG